MIRTNKTRLILLITALTFISLTTNVYSSTSPFAQHNMIKSSVAIKGNKGKCGEGKCGNSKKTETTDESSAKKKCGEGKCGNNKSTKAETESEGKCGSSDNETHDTTEKNKEGKCG